MSVGPSVDVYAIDCHLVAKRATRDAKSPRFQCVLVLFRPWLHRDNNVTSLRHGGQACGGFAGFGARFCKKRVPFF